MTKTHYYFITQYKDKYNGGLNKILFLLFSLLFTNMYLNINLMLIFISFSLNI